jgi:hypothetical protein
VQSVKDGGSVLEGWDGEAVEDGHQRLEFRGNAANGHGDFTVSVSVGGKNRHPEISRMRGMAWGPTFSPASASKSWLKRSSQTTSFAISVHHFSMSAEPARASRSILVTAVRTLALIGSSYFKIVDFEKTCENRLWRPPWDFGSRMLNMPARLSPIQKAAIFTYQSPFEKPSFTLWMMREAARSATATSSGLMRTIGPVRLVDRDGFRSKRTHHIVGGEHVYISSAILVGHST